VPTVINLTQAQAEAKLRAVGFIPVVSPAPNAAAKGKVVDQSPRPGEQFPANTKVTITVSSGPGEATVPDVTGYNVDSAKTAIAASGLTVSKVQTVDDPSVDKGLVIETVPKAGETVAAGSAVALKVASGKVKVPDVVGQDRGAATQALTVVHLKYKTNFQNSDQPEGTVLSQTHRNEVVDVSTVIVLVIAQAPAPTPTTAPTTPSSTATTGPP
jgi:beta-lactam-binding protein with PASTA domain